MSQGNASATRQIVFERRYAATLQEVWALWTTSEGIEAWWGPDGFAVKVQKLELWPGGALLYTMEAVGPDQIAYMKQAGMPLLSKHTVWYDEVAPPTCLAYTTLADFIPGVEPYNMATRVELFAEGDAVRLKLTIDAMHDARWTQMATMGWENELDRLARALASDKPNTGGAQ